MARRGRPPGSLNRAPIARSKGDKQPGRPPTKLPADALSLAQFAGCVHRSPNWIRKLLNEGKLRPAGHAGEHLVPYFTNDSVRQYYAAQNPEVAVTGEEAARVFTLIREGDTLSGIVEKTAMTPWKVDMIATDYARLNGAVFIEGELIDRINAMASTQYVTTERNATSFFNFISAEFDIAERKHSALASRAMIAEKEATRLNSRVRELVTQNETLRRELSNALAQTMSVPQESSTKETA